MISSGFVHFSIWWLVLALLLLIGAGIPALFWRGRRLAYIALICFITDIFLGLVWIRNWQAKESAGLYLVSKNAQATISRSFNVSSSAGSMAFLYIYSYDGTPDETRWHPDDSRPKLNWQLRKMPPGVKPGPIVVSPKIEKWGFGTVVRHGPTDVPNFSSGSWGIFFPNWFSAAVLALPMLLYARQLMRKRRVRRWVRTGCCERCGWDLRGTPPVADGSRRCAECGHINPSPQASPQSNIALEAQKPTQ